MKTSDRGTVRAFDMVVIGAGPAGLMAAIAAAECGAHVAVCEQLDQPGRKLLATGGGRCNLTNTLSDADFMSRFGRHGRFMQPALAAMNAPRLRDFFAALGVPTHCADGFHVFPVSESAGDVLDALLRRCRALKVELLLRTAVQSLRIREGQVTGVSVACDRTKREIVARAVVIATGGKSYLRASNTMPRPKTGTGTFCAQHPKGLQAKCTCPFFRSTSCPESESGLSRPRGILLEALMLGSTGGGYALAAQAGHQIVPPVPALVPLVTKERLPAQCAGVVISNTRVWIELPRRARSGCAGEVLFTHRGVSGPAVLDLSGDVARLLEDDPGRGAQPPPAAKEDRRGRLCSTSSGRIEPESLLSIPGGDAGVPIRIDLTPGTTAAQWRARFEEWHREHGRRAVSTALADHLPASPAERKRGQVPFVRSTQGAYRQKVPVPFSTCLPASLARAVCEVAGLPHGLTAAQFDQAQRAKLADCLTGLPLTAVATEGFERAMVTRGGVNLREVDPRTLASRRVGGLFFAGEVLDLDGPCGGFNLQWAFSSGHLAGRGGKGDRYLLCAAPKGPTGKRYLSPFPLRNPNE